MRRPPPGKRWGGDPKESPEPAPRARAHYALLTFPEFRNKTKAKPEPPPPPAGARLPTLGVKRFTAGEPPRPGPGDAAPLRGGGGGCVCVEASRFSASTPPPSAPSCGAGRKGGKRPPTHTGPLYSLQADTLSARVSPSSARGLAAPHPPARRRHRRRRSALPRRGAAQPPPGPPPPSLPRLGHMRAVPAPPAGSRASQVPSARGLGRAGTASRREKRLRSAPRPGAGRERASTDCRENAHRREPAPLAHPPSDWFP